MASRLQPLLLTALAAALLAACAPEPTTASQASVPPLDGDQATGLAGEAGAGALPQPVASAADAIAAYPDRGELVGYDRVRKPLQRGANTFHPVRVSEAHALAAIGTGTLNFMGPDGREVKLQYESHVEHANGDWSWVGRDEHGIDGILTFGEKAVFGVLPYGSDDMLRLTTDAGQTWMATTAKGVLSPLQQRMREGLVGPDYKVPPADAGAAGPQAMAASASASSAVAAAAPASATAMAAGTTIDVVLGYTPGFASMMGGTSQAQTRLNHLVTVGNQTFTNSAVAVSLRLVGTLQVNYADTGTNETALEQLTGSTGSSNVTIPASLQPLRNAREALGADLVSLVRRFRDAEHEGCGIAWLVGGAQSNIVAGHERFGYSVISDSNGTQAPDNGHFCRDETLVHELGHNLGSQHDTEAARGEDGNLDASDYGRYPYSFGLKTAAASGNFYTVMAYGDAGQTAWRVFSNPQITSCGGRACGVANQADNARSLRQTAPLIAAFRAAISGGARNDVDGDGRSDIVWRHSGNGRNTIWLGASSASQQSTATVPSQAWKLVGVDDFTGDGRADLLWRNETTGQNSIWPQGSIGNSISLVAVPGQAWNVAGTGDFDGDGMADILWRNSANGNNRIWRSGNGNSMMSVTNVPGLAWKVAGVGDINGDGRDDIVWRNTASGQNTAWLGAQHSATLVIATVPAQAWQVAAVDDFNGDGRADLLWRNSSTGANVIWNSGNQATQRSVATVSPQGWAVASSGDYDGDGSADILWRNSSSGANVVWRSGSISAQLGVTTVADRNWRVVH